MSDDIDDWNAAAWAQQDNDERWIYEHTHEGHAMKVSELTAGKYLAKTDFEDDQTCTIKGLRLEQLEDNGQNKEKPILYFREHPKGMVANNTTLRVLAVAFGDESDDWRGKQVIVYTDPNVSFGGKVVGGLRLRIPKQKTAPAPSVAAKQTAVDNFNNDLDADVPF